MTINGIDVSRWQGNINWNRVKSTNVGFAILKLGGADNGYYVDSCFEQNYTNAKAAGMPIGAYWYSDARSGDDARNEAKWVIEKLKGKQFEYPIYMDVEQQSVLQLGRDKVSDIIASFLNEMEKAGYFAGLYMSASPLTSLTTDGIKKRYAIWVAHYDVAAPSYSGQYGMWQKSCTGKISGISGNVDLDVCYVDYPTEIKKSCKNGFTTAPTPQPEPEPTPTQPDLKTIKAELTVDGVKYGGTLTEIK